MRNKWKEQYIIGEAQIDEQHRQIVMATEELLAQQKLPAEQAKEECKKTLDFLKHFMAVHFSTEEMYQQRMGFSEQAAHKKLHENFTVDLREFEFELVRTDYDRKVMQKLSRMMTQWWMYHIMKEDKKMQKEAEAKRKADKGQEKPEK